MKYQYRYTENDVAKTNMYDEHGRVVKAQKISAVLKDYYDDPQEQSVLDVSCSAGIISRYLSEHFQKVTGIDIDESAVSYAKAENNKANLEFHVMDALNTSFTNDSFDIVVCNQMYEHVPDANKLLDEIYRILVPGGICYFGATNKLKVIETHYGNLPFLSYFPKPIASFYLRLFNRGEYYYENLSTYWVLRRLCGKFEIIDYTKKVVREPDAFGMGGMVTKGGIKQRFALSLLNSLYWLSPGYIWLLRKPIG